MELIQGQSLVESSSLIDICGGGGIFLFLWLSQNIQNIMWLRKIFRIFLNRQLTGACQTLTLTPNRWFLGFVW
jgi:hypothetical protein